MPQPASIVPVNLALQLVKSCSDGSFGFDANGPKSDDCCTSEANRWPKYVLLCSFDQVCENEAFIDQRWL